MNPASALPGAGESMRGVGVLRLGARASVAILGPWSGHSTGGRIVVHQPQDIPQRAHDCPQSHAPDPTALSPHKRALRYPVATNMDAKGLTPILNVSNFEQSVEWFEKLGWTKGWSWGDPPSFGGVCSGSCEIFLCLNGQGGRGKSTMTTTFGAGGSDSAEKGVWMSIWVDDVDAVHQRCIEQGLDVMWPPTDMEWNTREMHVRHPDGHVLRISKGLERHE